MFSLSGAGSGRKFSEPPQNRTAPKPCYQHTRLEKFWLILLWMTDEAIAMLYVGLKGN